MRNKKNKVYIVAEVSANHGQSFDRAVKMIYKAKECGADAIKFQAYTPETMTLDCKNKHFMLRHSAWSGQSLYELYKKAYTPWDWFPKLKKAADNEGIDFFATAFDRTSVDMLESIKVHIHKIASFEIVDLPLIEYAASKKKSMIISTGMSSIEEIKDAVKAIRKNSCSDITLLKCVSSYPAEPKDMNLKTIIDMKKRFKCNIGLSDHSIENDAAVVCLSMGVSMIEKHFVLSRKDKTPDAFFSLEPEQLKELVYRVRIGEKMLGSINYGEVVSEKKNRMFRRSLFAVEDIKKDELLSKHNIRSIRPGYGLPPKFFKKVIGKKAKKNIKKGDYLKWEQIAL